MKATEISSLVEALEKDSNARFPRYPDQTIFIVKDERVVKAILSRFEESQSLSSISALPYNFRAGLNFVCFEFSPGGKGIGPNSFLAIVNGGCKVVAVIDPFDVTQPNQWVPPLPDKSDIETDAIPFAMARPSGVDKMQINTADIFPMEVRSREFFARLGGMGGIFGGGVGEIDDGSGGTATSCTYVTFMMWGGPFPGMGDRVFPNPQYDTTLDDCAPA
jgi:hypothetical protein